MKQYEIIAVTSKPYNFDGKSGIAHRIAIAEFPEGADPSALPTDIQVYKLAASAFRGCLDAIGQKVSSEPAFDRFGRFTGFYVGGSPFD